MDLRIEAIYALMTGDKAWFLSKHIDWLTDYESITFKSKEEYIDALGQSLPYFLSYIFTVCEHDDKLAADLDKIGKTVKKMFPHIKGVFGNEAKEM